MHSDRQIWEAWAARLQLLGATNFVAAVLDAGGPLSMLAAQLVYFSQPFLQWFIPSSQLEACARLLEEPERARAFALLLREGVR